MTNLYEDLANLKDDIRREFKKQALKSGVNESRNIAYAFYQGTTSNLFLIINEDKLLMEMHLFIDDKIDNVLREITISKHVPLKEAIPNIEAFLALDYSCEDMVNKRISVELSKVTGRYRKHLYEGESNA